MSGFYAELDKEPRSVPFPPKHPWSGVGLPWTQPTPYNGVMRFEAADKAPARCKRKYDIIPPIPSKVLITEEKMIAHFNGLHISDFEKLDSDVENAGEWDLAEHKNYTIPMSSKELEQKLKNATKITVCEELKKFDGADSFIRKMLLERKEEPCTALVIWRPPPKLKDLIAVHSDEKKTPETEAESKPAEELEIDEEDNNNSSSIDFNSNNNNNNNNSDDAMDTDL